MLSVCLRLAQLQIDVSDRMMGTLQVFTGLISFLFVAGGDTPKLPYQTRLDLFMMFSFCLVAFIMFIHGVLYYFREQGFAGSKLDKLEFVEAQKRREFIAKRKGAQRARGSVVGIAIRSTGSAYGVSKPGDPNSAEVAPSPSGVEMASPQASARQDAMGSAPIKSAFEEGGGQGVGSPAALTTDRKSEDDTKALPNRTDSTPSNGLGPEKITGRQGSKDDVYDEHTEDGGWEVRLNDWSQWSFVAWFASLACTRKWDVIIVPFLFAFYTIGSAAILGREHSDGSAA
jgi:hypothetical protein